MASRGRGHRGRPRGTGQAPLAFDQQAFTEAIGIAVAAIAQACAVVNQGRSNDLQHIEAHYSPLGIEGGVDDIQGTQDICVGAKRKEVHLLPIWGRGRRLLLHTSFRTKARRADVVLFLPPT